MDGRSPIVSYHKIGCEVYVKQTINYLQKVLVGYPKEMRGYYVYCPSDNKVFVVRS